MATVFITGGTGFLGRRVVAALRAAGEDELRLLVRPGSENDLDSEITIVPGDLAEPGGYAEALEGVDVVLHLAALTGKAPRRRHLAVNRDGTAALVKAAEAAGVDRFVFVSSIAAGFERPKHYHYADAKREAEAAVRASGLRWTILRPTMIFGENAPVLDGLKTLAGAPLVPVFGSGRAMLQPVDVDDLSAMIVDLLRTGEGEGEVWDVGGADRLSIEELLLELRRRAGKTNRRTLHLPLGFIRGCLALCEPLLLPLLPLTAGQLSSFAHDGVAEDNPLLARHRAELKSLEVMLGGEAS